MSAEDLIEIEHAGRRCGVCRSGRGWRRFQIVRPAGRDPVVLCGSCRARFGDAPPNGRKATPTPELAIAERQVISAPKAQGERRTERRPDRLRTALRKMPDSFSTATAARAAGLNHHKALARLHDLERHGEVHRIGSRWSTKPPVDDQLASALDRLEARTSNLRIVRDHARVR